MKTIKQSIEMNKRKYIQFLEKNNIGRSEAKVYILVLGMIVVYLINLVF